MPAFLEDLELTSHFVPDETPDEEPNDGQVVPLRLIEGSIEELIQHPRLSLANVKGLARSKRLLNEVLTDVRSANREKPLGSVLMYGPPYCGKTFLNRVLAGELGWAMLEIEVKDIAEQAANGRGIRDAMRIAERNKPIVLFFNQIDAIHESVSDLDAATRKATVEEIGNVLDAAAEGMPADLLITTTATYPWNIDPSLVGPGRLSEILLVLPPDEPARTAILREALPHLRLDDDIDLEWLAKHTDGYSGSDIQRICEVANSLAAQDFRSAPEMADLKHAFHSVQSNAAAWLSSAAQHAMMSPHSGMYDDLVDYLNARRK